MNLSSEQLTRAGRERERDRELDSAHGAKLRNVTNEDNDVGKGLSRRTKKKVLCVANVARQRKTRARITRAFFSLL